MKQPEVEPLRSTESDFAVDLSRTAMLGAYGLCFAACKTVVAPFDRWRVLRQVFPERQLKYRDLLFRGWTGVLPHVSHSVLLAGAHLSVLSLLEQNGFGFSPIFNPIAASIVATTFSYPLDVRYTRQITVSTSSQRAFAGLRLALLASPLSVIGSLSGLSFLSMVFPLPDHNASNIDYCRGVALGTASALVGSVLTYPIDTYRRRMIFGTSLGKKRLFSGISVHLFKSVPECALLTIGYLSIRQWFQDLV